jgi:hypothetical protein
MGLRVRRDNRQWTKWVRKSLGRAGESDMLLQFGSFGQCAQMQIEIDMTDAAPFEIVAMHADLEALTL